VAYRKAFDAMARDDNGVGVNASRLEKKPDIRARIEFLARQAQERIVEKRVTLEEQLWGVLEADIGDFWETYETSGKAGELETDQEGRMLTARKQRAKLINDLPPEFRKLIEDVTVDRHGNVIPKLYSKAQANRGLRELLDIGRREPEANDGPRLSDAELIAQLSDQAQQLGVKIDLSYSFDQAPPAASEPTEANGGGQVIDGDSDSKVASARAVESRTADCSDADAQAARELTTSALPTSSQRRQTAAPAGARKLQRNARSRP
jgi:hypothetical protein